MIIAKKSFAFNDAPPTNPPSMSGLEKISFALLPFTLPPYKIEISDLILKPSFEGITMPTSILLVCVETFLIVLVKGKNPITPPF